MATSIIENPFNRGYLEYESSSSTLTYTQILTRFKTTYNNLTEEVKQKTYITVGTLRYGHTGAGRYTRVATNDNNDITIGVFDLSNCRFIYLKIDFSSHNITADNRSNETLSASMYLRVDI